MRGHVLLLFAFCACLVTASIAEGAAVEVTVWADKDPISIGETATLTVYGQLMPGYADAGNGIFGWDVDLRVGDTAILELLPATLDRSGWTGNAMTSSSGTPVSWGLDAIYDTGEADTEMGIGSPVALFSIQFKGLSLGITTLTVEPDMVSGADFVSWQGATGGNYSGASVDITVVPEPATISFLGLGMAALLRRRRLR